VVFVFAGLGGSERAPGVRGRTAVVQLGSDDGVPGRRMDRMISVAAIDEESRRLGHCLLVDVDGRLITWGRPRTRERLAKLLSGREGEMKRFLTARALREER
jgi:hypothetical protein